VRERRRLAKHKRRHDLGHRRAAGVCGDVAIHRAPCGAPHRRAEARLDGARAGVADQFDLRAGLAADRCAAFQQIGFGVGVGEAQAGRGAGADGVADPVAPVRLRERPSAASSTSCSWPTP